VSALTVQAFASPAVVAVVGTLAVVLVARGAHLRVRRHGRRRHPVRAVTVAAALGVLVLGCTAADSTTAAEEGGGSSAETPSATPTSSGAPLALEEELRVDPQFYPPLLDPERPPPAMPPLDVTSRSGVQPGTVVFTTYTSPRVTADQPYHPSFLIELDKQSGELTKAQQMLTPATMLQPEPDGRYSYNIVDKSGVDGAGFEVTHYVTDAELAVTEAFNLDDLEDGDADLHDFELLDNGNALLLAYRRRQVDLTEFGGPADGLVWDTVIAERTPDGETVWEWDGADHMDLEDVPEQVAKDQLTSEPPAVGDYSHPNSLEVFPDGDVLVSIRHYDCLYRIDRGTGDIGWTFGGRNCVDNEFDISGDPVDGPSHQHDATVLENGNILLFDNGNLHDERVSRVVEYAIDEEAKTAELVWSYDDDRYTPIMGSAERLANGNTLIGWGALVDPVITEVTPEGEEVFSLSVPPGQLVYRAYQGSRD
jgi:hypothetical protein